LVINILIISDSVRANVILLNLDDGDDNFKVLEVVENVLEYK